MYLTNNQGLDKNLLVSDTVYMYSSARHVPDRWMVVTALPLEITAKVGILVVLCTSEFKLLTPRVHCA